MGDWVILRFPLDDPEKPEVVEVLANAPIKWKQYLKNKANKIKKKGRYIVTNILYDQEYYYPESLKKRYKKVEKNLNN